MTFNVTHVGGSDICKIIGLLCKTFKELDLHFLDSTTYRLDVFIAGESLVQFAAHDFELPVEVVGRLLVGVGDLSDDLLVVVHHVGSHNLGTIDIGAANNVQTDQHGLIKTGAAQFLF